VFVTLLFTMRPDTAAGCQTDKFEEVRIPQASLIPNMAENYRCMLVWDTRTNRDVGWLMVRKKAVNGRKSEEVAAEMSQCQWRNWNLNSSKEEGELCGNDPREILPESVTKNASFNKVEEATTSSESKSVDAPQEERGKVDFGVQVETELLLQKDMLDVARCRPKNSGGEPPKKKTKLGNAAVIESSLFDKMEVVVGFVNNNENVIKDDTDEGKLAKDVNEEDISTVWKMKKAKTLHSEKLNINEKLADKFISVCKGDNKKEIRMSHSMKLLECPECGKSVKQKSFSMHLRVVHNIRSAVMTFCNVCKKRILEVNLMLHRKTFHPERFQKDMIGCSGCQKQVRAVEFDGHECVVEDASTRPEVGDELINSSKYSRLENLGETCNDCSVTFSGDEIRYHDCKKKSSVVRLKRLKIKPIKPAMGEVQVLKAGNLMCEDCGKLFNDSERLDQHDCNETFVEEHYFEHGEEDGNLAFGKIGERNTSSNVAEFQASGTITGLKNVHSQAEVKPGGSVSPANVNEAKDSIGSRLPAKIIELRGALTLAKILESKGALATAKIVEPRKSSTPVKLIKPRGSLSPVRKQVEPPSGIIVEGRGSQPARAMEPKCALSSAKVVGQPPQFLRRGDAFTMTLKLLDINKNSLQIQSACLTAACRGSSVLEFRLELLQADGSITLQPLWISICSSDQPAVLLKCLIPCHIPCRMLGKDQLQFSMSCDLAPGITECKYKLVVATKQLVLCYSREMIMYEPEQKKTNEGC